MPRKSKRAAAPILSKVKKKDADNKRAQMEKVRDLVDQYSHCFVIDTENFRNIEMKRVKQELADSRFFQGKIAPTLVTLGKKSSDAYRENIHRVSLCLRDKAKGAHKGLFFTNRKPADVIQYFAQVSIPTFAKTGFVATTTRVIREGVLDQFVFSQEIQLRKLGLPVLLKQGRLLLNQDHIVCERGQPLTPEQCKLLELLGDMQAQFRFNLYGYWFNNEFFEIVNKNTKIESIESIEERKSDDQSSNVESAKDENKNSVDPNLAEAIARSNAHFGDFLNSEASPNKGANETFDASFFLEEDSSEDEDME